MRRDGIEGIRKLESAEEDVCLAAALYGVQRNPSAWFPKFWQPRPLGPNRQWWLERTLPPFADSSLFSHFLYEPHLHRIIWRKDTSSLLFQRNICVAVIGSARGSKSSRLTTHFLFFPHDSIWNSGPQQLPLLSKFCQNSVNYEGI